MLQLGFHVDRPFELTLIFGGVALCFGSLWWGYSSNLLKVKDLLGGYFQRRLGASGPERAHAAARVFLAGFTLLMAGCFLFAASVASGVLKNGERARPARSAESQALQQFLEGQGGSINMEELVRQNAQKQQAEQQNE